MNEHNKKVEPLRFEPAASPDSTATASKAPAGTRNWVVPALASLLVVAILVFFWLPQQVDTEAVAVEAASQTELRQKSNTPDVTPWSDAQLAKQRKDAQAVLAELLDEQFRLEELRVAQWAEADFSAAQALATGGDEQYREKAYLEAATSYQAALDAMLAISASIDTVFAELMQTGLAALGSDQVEPALQALELAVHLQPDNEIAFNALARATKLAPLLDLLAQANAARDRGELESARDLLQQASRLDPEHVGTTAQLRDVVRQIAKQNYNRAMTAGYQALAENRYDEAEREFQKAQSILPAAAETESALQQTRSARTAAKIDAFAKRATAATDREDWPQAVAAYREILEIDNSVVFARAGLINAQTRASLASDISAALANPNRLSDPAIYNNTRAMYQSAVALEQKGPLLRKQLAELDQVLRLALIPVPVLLHSDEQTDVTIYKVARLGTFARQQLDLKPGNYTAVGVRSGYRDVRVQISVSHQQQNPVFEIICSEPI
jgi:tetratricopeptide (TPR) repeat protein